MPAVALAIPILLAKGAASSPITFQIRKAAPGGGYEDAAGQFTGDEPLEFVVWEGEDRPPLDVDFPAEWVDGPAGLVRISFPAESVGSLAEGTYNGRLKLASGGWHLLEFVLTILEGPGLSPARPAYCTIRDLKNELPWIGDQIDQGTDQSGFQDVLADARDWLDRIIVRHHRPYTGRGVVSWDRGWDWNAGSSGHATWLADALADGKLMLETPDGRGLVKACVHYALAQILRRSVGRTQVAGLLDLAIEFEARANNLVMSSTAEIDVDGDGRAEYSIRLGATNTRRR